MQSLHVRPGNTLVSDFARSYYVARRTGATGGHPEPILTNSQTCTVLRTVLRVFIFFEVAVITLQGLEKVHRRS